MGMRKLKIAVIGAGSTYTPELVEGFISRKNSLDIDSFYFMDIDRNKLEVVGELSKRMLEANGITSRLIMTQSLEEAIEGADYILAQVRVGGLDARIRDEKIPLKYNLLGQETTGAGGFMKALRTIPVIMDVAKKMERLAPKSWLINFSNPSGIVAETVLNQTGINMMGLCNVPINMVKAIKDTLPENTKQFDYEYIGLNHLSWITGIYADGRDLLKEQLCGKAELSTFKNIPEVVYEDILLKATGAIPSPYLSYFYLRDEQIKHCMEAEKTRGEVCKEIEADLLNKYKDVNLTDKPLLLEQRGGSMYSTAAISLVDAIENNKNEVHVVNVKNNGALSFMDDNDVVEVKCLINKNGATPIKMENFDNPYIIGLMKAVKVYEKLTSKAGLEGNYETALAALLAHPLIGDYHKAKGVLDEMLEANRDFLPQFFKGER
ncbi:MAG: 6-phospho-beta-glucosidase [Clostridia bacterium]|nr:6-phospho-beta-glucosidase [Clostridia bacterium]